MSETGSRKGILTPANSPGHWVIGRLWVGYNGQFYFCESYDPRMGFWLRNIANPSDRRNISERAPTRTFHKPRGVLAKSDLIPEREYHAVDLVNGPFESKPMDYTQALAAPFGVAIFDEAYRARARLAEAAHQDRLVKGGSPGAS
jgi:hypothetical protein